MIVSANVLKKDLSPFNHIFRLIREVMVMGKSKLQVICGLKVVDAVLAIGDAGMSFENGISLAIYNKFVLVGIALGDAKLLIGKVVADVDEREHIITIKFENSMAIKIDMRDEAYTGPEAMQLRVPGEPIVIWN